MSMRRQFPLTIEALIERDRRVQVLLGDIGVFGFRHVFERYEKNILNLGILEQATVGVAAGLAIGGDSPVVHTIAPFLIERAYEQLKIDFGYQQLPGNFVSVGGSYDYAALGCTHHCPADLAVILNIPNFEIVVPGTASEFDSLFKERYAGPSPTYFRLSEFENSSGHDVKFGSNTVIKHGKKSGRVVIAVGPMLDRVLEATVDRDITVLYCTTLYPFDCETVVSLNPKHICMVLPSYASAGYDLLGPVASELGARLDIIGVPRSFIRRYGLRHEIDEFIGLDAAGISASFSKIGI